MLKCEYCGTNNEFDSYYRDKRRYTCEKCGAPLPVPKYAKYQEPQYPVLVFVSSVTPQMATTAYYDDTRR